MEGENSEMEGEFEFPHQFDIDIESEPMQNPSLVL
jgi:hypothetical protein